MTKLRLRASLLSCVIVLCGAGAFAARQTVTVPFVVRGLGTLTPRPDGAFDVTGAGEGTHLGHFTVSGIQTLQPGMPPTFEGHVTFSAADGDELYVTVTGIMTSAPPNPAGAGGYEITGGSGRFEGASGEGAFSADAEGTRYDGFIRFSPGQ